MTTILYHPELIEQAVWITARRDAATEYELHRSIDPIYELPQGDDRETRFLETFAKWFTRLKLGRFVDETLVHFPRIVEQVEECVVRLAPRRKSEGAELFVRRENGGLRRTLVAQFCAQTLVEPECVRDVILRELQHVEDMLDEAFGYVPDAIDGLPVQQQVVRDRYGVLWDVRVEAALERRRLLGSSAKARVWRLFERAFTVGGLQPHRALFEDVWQCRSLSHSTLLAWAREPRAWLRESLGQGQVTSSASPGEPCPMCGFPTFDWWALSDAQDKRIGPRIRESVPGWNPSDGLCRQCAETLAVEAGPPTRGEETQLAGRAQA